MKLNLVEKRGFIALVAILLFFGINIFIIGSKNLWFESKNTYYTKISDAEGLRVGSLVTLNGLRVGQVSHLDVDKDNKIKVTFNIKKSLAVKVRENSKARVIRAFLIGDKRIDFVPGTEDSPLVANKGTIQGQDSHELADLVSGKNLARIGDQMSGVTMGIQKLSETIIMVTEKVKPAEIAKTYEVLLPTMNNLYAISKDLKNITKEINKSKNTISPFMINGNQFMITAEKTFLPFSKRGPLMNEMLDNTSVLSKELARNPDFATKMVVTLNEMVVTLKAIQKTWLLDEYVKKIKDKQKNGK